MSESNTSKNEKVETTQPQDGLFSLQVRIVILSFFSYFFYYFTGNGRCAQKQEQADGQCA